MSDWVVGIDLGGTKIEIGLVSPENQIVGHRRIPTNPAQGPESVVNRIIQCVDELASLLPAGKEIAALGICSPGPVDHESGALIDPPNLAGLHNAPLGPMLSERLNIPVRLEHDAKAAALGEFYYGAGRGEQNMVYIVAGTGVGSAIIANGQLFRGPFNSAGEVGHVTLDRNGELCSCGSKGCFETFIAGPWLARRYQRLIEQSMRESPLAGEKITGDRVALLAAQGDPLARQVMDDAGDALGVAVATLAMILNIDMFVIGGSVSKAGDVLLEPARRSMPKHCYRSVGCEVRIVPSELGDNGPVLGCAWLARQALHEWRESRKQYAITSVSRSEQESLEKVEGYVFDVQRFSLHDGSGVRTNIFLKGCPLRCPWCANPESQHSHPELSLSKNRCINCNLFEEACIVSWGQDGPPMAGHEDYAARAAVCPTCALRWVGERRTAGAVMEDVLRDVPFYDEGGGLTLTGGEPTFQPRMAEALLRLAKIHGISTAIETSGHTRWKILERLVPYLDEILYDIKHVDGDIHKSVVGVDNTLILTNLHKLASLGAPVSVRVPLIPGFNASEASLGAIADLVTRMDGLVKSVCLLPYHTLGKPKYQALNRDYPWEGHERLNDNEIQRLSEFVTSRGLAVTIGG